MGIWIPLEELLKKVLLDYRKTTGRWAKFAYLNSGDLAAVAAKLETFKHPEFRWIDHPDWRGCGWYFYNTHLIGWDNQPEGRIVATQHYLLETEDPDPQAWLNDSMRSTIEMAFAIGIKPGIMGELAKPNRPRLSKYYVVGRELLRNVTIPTGTYQFRVATVTERGFRHTTY